MIELMRDRITIQKSSVKTDKIGNHAAVWEDVYSCAAYANNLSGKEYWAAKQLNAQSELDFIIRYCSEVAALDSEHYRIRFRGIFIILRLLITCSIKTNPSGSVRNGSNGEVN